MAECSSSIGRQLGAVADRNGNITHVIAGDAKGLVIPDLADYPLGRKVLRGLRLIHTHLKNEQINQDDITDLLLLRLDALIAIGIKNSMPENISSALLKSSGSQKAYEITGPVPFHRLDASFENFDEMLSSLEDELGYQKSGFNI